MTLLIPAAPVDGADKHTKRTVYSPGVAADDAVKALRKSWPA